MDFVLRNPFALVGLAIGVYVEGPLLGAFGLYLGAVFDTLIFSLPTWAGAKVRLGGLLSARAGAPGPLERSYAVAFVPPAAIALACGFYFGVLLLFAMVATGPFEHFVVWLDEISTGLDPIVAVWSILDKNVFLSHEIERTMLSDHIYLVTSLGALLAVLSVVVSILLEGRLHEPADLGRPSPDDGRTVRKALVILMSTLAFLSVYLVALEGFMSELQRFGYFQDLIYRCLMTLLLFPLVPLAVACLRMEMARGPDHRKAAAPTRRQSS